MTGDAATTGAAVKAMPLTHQFSCQATDLGVRDLMLRFDQVVRNQDLGDDLHSSVAIAVTEGLNNIVEHALTGRVDETIDVALCVNAVHVFVLLEDAGMAMPGWQIPTGCPAVIPAARADLPEGGFGWSMIRSLTDRVDYSRLNGMNRLKMWFLIPPKGRLCGSE